MTINYIWNMQGYGMFSEKEARVIKRNWGTSGLEVANKIASLIMFDGFSNPTNQAFVEMAYILETPLALTAHILEMLIDRGIVYCENEHNQKVRAPKQVIYGNSYSY